LSTEANVIPQECDNDDDVVCPPTTYIMPPPCEYDYDVACPPETYAKFVDYYGAYDYGDDWIQAAFAGTTTNFTHANADFGLLSKEGRAGKRMMDGAFLLLLSLVFLGEGNGRSV
jgi:hypothetical protein